MKQWRINITVAPIGSVYIADGREYAIQVRDETVQAAITVAVAAVTDFIKEGETITLIMLSNPAPLRKGLKKDSLIRIAPNVKHSTTV